MNIRCHRLVFDRSRGFCIAVAETAASAGKPATGERRAGSARTAVAAALGTLSLLCQAQVASVLPTGATVVKGNGTVRIDGMDMTVTQGSQRLVADWQSFSIGAGNSVRFVQPSSSAVALNRVTGNDPSAIFGALTANGHVYLQNANGVYFAPGAQVSVGGLLATSLGVELEPFMLGRLRLSGGDASSGAVDNAGRIVAAPGGHVVLAAPRVSNSGSIATPGGTTALVAGNAVEIDPLGSGLLRVSVPVAAVSARLAQSGMITADGGAVQLAAAAADAAVQTVMQVGGVVRARSIEQRDGQIVLSGGRSGAVMVDGQLDASANGAGHGGTIKVLGDLVGVTGQARLDASGGAGGGTILVGGNWQGRGAEANARNTSVGSGAVLDASATAQGDGGTVVVWSDGHTGYAGQANARGGAGGGNGGRVEVSGKGSLRFEGGVDLTAPRGTTGSLLLDPQNLVVGNVADVNGDATVGDDLVANVFVADPGGTSQVTAGRVATLLDTANVTLQSQFTLRVNAAVNVPAGGASTTLALQSADIAVNAALNLNNASLAVNTTPTFTTQQIVLNAPVTSNNAVSLTSPTISLNAALTARDVTLTGSGTIAQSAAGTGTINATNLSILGGFNNIDLGFSNNQATNLTLDMGNGPLRIGNPAGVPLDIRGSANSLALTTVNTNVTQSLLPAGAISFGVGEGAASITTIGSGNVALTNPLNSVAAGITFNVAGNLDLVVQGSLGAEGSATGDIHLRSAGQFSLNNNLSGRNIDITSAGFYAQDTLLLTPPGGRFFIRSSDYNADFFNTPLFGTGANDINYVVLGGFTGTDPATGNGYYTNRTGTITPPVTDNPPITKVYDGGTGFTFLQTGASATAALQTVSVPIPFTVNTYTVNSTGAFADKNAGVNKGHTVAPTTNTVATDLAQNGLLYYGLQFAGYTRAPGVHVPGTPGNAVSQITPKPIISTGIDGVDRVYNATTTVGLNLAGASLSGVVAGDTVTLSGAGAVGTVANKNVGIDKPVTVSGLALGGADALNYTVTAAPGATATISQLGITSSGLAGIDRVYDGTTAVGLSGAGATLSGVLSGDSVGVGAGSTGTVANKNVGTAKPVTVGTVVLNGADAINYAVTGNTGTPVVTITPLGITSTGVTGVDRSYDASTAVAVNTGAATLNGTIAGDNVSLVGTAATGTMANKNAGLAKPVTVGGLALGGADAVNYSLTDASNATVNIAQAVLQATGITAVDRVVDGTTTVQIDASGATVTGIVPGDTVGIDPTGAIGSVPTPDPGTRPVSVAGITLTGLDAANYSIAPVPLASGGGGLTVRILSTSQGRFEDLRFKEYLQAVSDAQEPFRRAMAEALASGFGKENIRKQLQRGLVFETGLAPPAIDIIEPATRPEPCTPPGGSDLNCAR